MRAGNGKEDNAGRYGCHQRYKAEQDDAHDICQRLPVFFSDRDTEQSILETLSMPPGMAQNRPRKELAVLKADRPAFPT
jgi:hypothetical protein